MKLRTLQPKTFTQLFEVLKEALTDVEINFHPDTIQIRATDSAQTCITYVNLFGKTIDKYECKEHVPGKKRATAPYGTP